MRAVHLCRLHTFHASVRAVVDYVTCYISQLILTQNWCVINMSRKWNSEQGHCTRVHTHTHIRTHARMHANKLVCFWSDLDLAVPVSKLPSPGVILAVSIPQERHRAASADGAGEGAETGSGAARDTGSVQDPGLHAAPATMPHAGEQAGEPAGETVGGRHCNRPVSVTIGLSVSL